MQDYLNIFSYLILCIFQSFHQFSYVFLCLYLILRYSVQLYQHNLKQINLFKLHSFNWQSQYSFSLQSFTFKFLLFFMFMTNNLFNRNCFAVLKIFLLIYLKLFIFFILLDKLDFLFQIYLLKLYQLNKMFYFY